MAGVALLAAALTACVPVPEPEEQTLDLVWPVARTALDDAVSLRVTAEWEDDPQTPQDDARSVVVAGPLTPGPYRGTATGPAGTTETILADGVAYVRTVPAGGSPTPAARAASPAAGGLAYAQVPVGTWLALPDDGGALASPGDVTRAVAEGLPDAHAFDGLAIVPTPVTVEGRALRRYADVPLPQGHADLYLDGHDRLVRIDRAGAAQDSGTPDAAVADVVRLEDWNDVPPVTAPPSADVYARPGL